MQEYNDGSFGEIKQAEDFKKLFEPKNADDLANTKAVHFGTEEQLKKLQKRNEELQQKDSSSVKDYLYRMEEKMDMIIKHFKIVHIIGQD